MNRSVQGIRCIAGSGPSGEGTGKKSEWQMEVTAPDVLELASESELSMEAPTAASAGRNRAVTPPHNAHFTKQAANCQLPFTAVWSLNHTATHNTTPRITVISRKKRPAVIIHNAGRTRDGLFSLNPHNDPWTIQWSTRHLRSSAQCRLVALLPADGTLAGGFETLEDMLRARLPPAGP